jgi:hypothetical protein
VDAGSILIFVIIVMMRFKATSEEVVVVEKQYFKEYANRCGDGSPFSEKHQRNTGRKT